MASPARRRRPSRSRTASQLFKAFGPLRSYRVEGLFEHGNNFQFDLDKHEPTLLTGVNGTGKSTILRTIDAISSMRWSTLAEIPFEQITLAFETLDVTVTRRGDKDKATLTIRVGEDSEPWEFSTMGRVRVPATVAAEAMRHGLRVYRGDDERIGYYMRSEDIYDSAFLMPSLLAFAEEGTPSPTPPSTIISISQRFSVLFVTDQRLVVESPKNQPPHIGAEQTPTRVAVEEAAREVGRHIQRAKSNYATKAQELDSNFPQRVVEAMRTGHVSRQLLISNLEKLTELRTGLEATGLLAAEEATVSFDQLGDDPSVLPVMDTYVRDTIAKLETLEPLRRRLKLFTDFLNQHYSSKRVVIDQENGFRIEVEPASGRLPPARLSSGEQQMLVLAHKILFGTKPGTLVLIDEPELSLHVTWQATFVDDLARMGQIDELTFLLATHSPTLIHGREDLKRSLDVQ